MANIRCKTAYGFQLQNSLLLLVYFTVLNLDRSYPLLTMLILCYVDITATQVST